MIIYFPKIILWKKPTNWFKSGFDLPWNYKFNLFLIESVNENVLGKDFVYFLKISTLKICCELGKTLVVLL